MLSSSPFSTRYCPTIHRMIFIALSFTMSALWLILSPWNLLTTQLLLLASIIPLVLWLLVILIRKYRKDHRQAQHTLPLAPPLFLFVGALTAYLIYPPLLSDYRSIQQALPLQIESQFTILRNHLPTSTTIQIESIAPQSALPEPLEVALSRSEVTLYNVEPNIKSMLEEGARYEALIEIKPRMIRNIPGNRERILSLLSRQSIGYGRLKTDPILISPPDKISQLRREIAQYLHNNYRNSAYLSALSVGKTDQLTQHDWQTLRQTGTIHLVSISGLHLSLTAFYAFVLFRILFGLLQIRIISPFRLAALLSIIVAWNYTLLAGMSLPTIRAAIMFSVAMISLVISRPIFNLHSVALALLIILLLMPFALLTAGFWLSFIAVITLILAARLLQSPIKALLLTQLLLSILLIPLTASFFGEISLISPLINLIAIPWTTIMIMPALLTGIVLYLITPPLSHPFLLLADQGITVLKYLITQSARIPFASMEVSQIPLFIAVLSTLSLLTLLYFAPFLRHRISLLSGLQYRLITANKEIVQESNEKGEKDEKDESVLSHPTYHQSMTKRYLRIKQFIISIPLILTLSILFPFHREISPLFTALFQRPSVSHYRTTIDPSKILRNKLSQELSDFQIAMYQLPVGEGLSFLLTTQDFTLLFDTGNRFRQFDAGKNIINPTLRNLQISTIDYLILSKRNQQHIGGTQSVLTAYPNSDIWTLPQLQTYLPNAQNCRELKVEDDHYTIKPLTTIQSSCALHLTLYQMIDLYLIADIQNREWPATLQYIRAMQQQFPEREIVLLYPNQGRRYFALDTLFDSNNQLTKPTTTQKNLLAEKNGGNRVNSTDNRLGNPHSSMSSHPIILFSTRALNRKIEATMQRYQQPIYNGYQSTISLHFNYQKAKSLLELRLEDYRDQYRYSWLQPVQ